MRGIPSRKLLLASVSVSLLFPQAALAAPQFGGDFTEVEFRRGVEAFASVDISSPRKSGVPVRDDITVSDRQFLKDVAREMARNPESKQEIAQRAAQERPHLLEDIKQLASNSATQGPVDISSDTPSDSLDQLGGERAEGTTGSSSALVIGGIGALAAGGAAMAMGGGGSSGGSSSSGSKKKDDPWENPDPLPPPEYGDKPSDFETSEYLSNSSLGQIGASTAYSRKLSGENVILAVMDTGIDLGHSEFKDRIVNPFNAHFNNQDVTDRNGHGTHVAGIVGAAKDGKGMHGVAWSSRILPVSFADKNGNLWSGEGSATIERGWNHAASHGAKAINNSWSYPNLYMDNTDKAEIEKVMPRLVASARNLVEKDVITVFTTGNDSRGQPSVTAGLPHFYPELKGHWIAVGAVDSKNRLSSYSNYCGDAAEWCMVAPGDDIYSSVPGGYTRYSGTSMAAPHVTGAIGVLYQAFPYLTAEEIVQILFETADDIGPAEKFGHGLLNLEKATRPIGETRIPTGTDIAGGSESLSASSLYVSAAFGDGIGQALSGRSLIALDDYNRDYRIDMGSLARTKQLDTGKDALHRLKLFGGIEERSQNTIRNGPFSITTATRLRASDPSLGDSHWSRMSFAFSGHGYSMEASMNPDLGRSFGFREMGFADAPLMDATGFDQPHLGLVESGYSSSFGFGLAEGSELRLGVFSGNVHVEDSSLFANAPSVYGAVGQLTTEVTGGLSVSAAAGAVSEQGSLLGSVSSGAFGESMRSNTLFTSLGATFDLAPNTRLTLTGSLGQTSFRQNGGMIRSGQNIVTTSFGAGIAQQALLQDNDVLSLAVSQPLRVEAGRVNLSVPTSRNMDGSIGYSRMSLSPQPSGREINLQAAYGFEISDGIGASLGAMHRFDANHVKGNRETIGMFSMSFKF